MFVVLDFMFWISPNVFSLIEITEFPIRIVLSFRSRVFSSISLILVFVSIMNCCEDCSSDIVIEMN